MIEDVDVDVVFVMIVVMLLLVLLFVSIMWDVLMESVDVWVIR